MVGGDDHQGLAIGLSEGQGLLHGFVEVDGLADLAARIRGVVLLVDGRALDLQEEAVRIVLQQLDGLAGHLRQGRDVGGALRVRLAAHRRLVQVAVVGGGRTEPAHWHVARREQADQRLLLVGAAHGFQLVEVLDDPVAAGFGLGAEGLAGIAASLGGFREGRGAAAENHVRAGLQPLLGDRAGAAVLQGIARALLAGGLGTVALASGDVGEQGGGGGVLQLGGGDVAGGLAVELGQLQQVAVRLFVDIHADRAVVRLDPGGPGGGGGGGIGHVVRQAAVLVQGVVGVLAGQRQRIDTLEVAARAARVVARHGDLGVAHAVADQQDHVLRLLLRQRLLQGLGQVLLDAPCAAVFAEFATGLAVEQRRIVLARLGRQGAAEHGHGDGKREGEGITWGHDAFPYVEEVAVRDGGAIRRVLRK